LAGDQAELETIAVAAPSQRQGVGRQLWAAMARELRLAGVREVRLEVRASNRPAIGLYRALGFAETGRRPRYYADPAEDAVLMDLQLG
jgi:ribosomal-protein-alanine N-acetyltransferase